MTGRRDRLYGNGEARCLVDRLLRPRSRQAQQPECHADRMDREPGDQFREAGESFLLGEDPSQDEGHSPEAGQDEYDAECLHWVMLRVP